MTKVYSSCIRFLILYNFRIGPFTSVGSESDPVIRTVRPVSVEGTEVDIKIFLVSLIIKVKVVDVSLEVSVEETLGKIFRGFS